MSQGKIDNNVIESLKEIMGEAFDILITTYRDDTGKLIQSLSELHQQNDIEVFTRNAHSIKSSSANVGAMQVSSLAAELEAQGKIGDISNSLEKINHISLEFDMACKELSTF